ncbi:SLATT domain-containing protein [Nonomuraea sp. NPDC049714]|jgi:hypothetical protein|uniref:SLATT domain-containing protein n=1 Tax=Nonomuraea sp. NPDC049714 TaxID=3364357 RepID=UPI003792CB8E
MDKTSRNLVPAVLDGAHDGEPLELATALFRHAERNALTTINWYLWKKTIKSRWSRILRASAIVLAVAGGVTPLLHAASPGLIASGWGYVALALSAGCVLFDRYFGYTSSWMRYMRAQARLHRVLVTAQAQWTAAMIQCTHAAAPVDVLMPIVQDLIKGTAETVELETDEWARELTEQSEQLQRTTEKDDRQRR